MSRARAAMPRLEDLALAQAMVREYEQPDRLDDVVKARVAAGLDRYLEGEHWADARSDHQLACRATPAAEAQRRAEIAACQARPDSEAPRAAAQAQPGTAEVACATEVKAGGAHTHTVTLPPKLPHSVAWRHTTCGSERTDLRMRMFFRDDVEARPVDDKEFEELDAIDELVRRQAHTHSTPLAAVLADWCCHPQAMLAVMVLERWRSWGWVLAFASESPTVMQALCRDIESGRAAALHAALAAPLPAAAMPRRGAGRAGKRPRSASANGGETAEAARVRARVTSAMRVDGTAGATSSHAAGQADSGAALTESAEASSGSECAHSVLVIGADGAQRSGLPSDAGEDVRAVTGAAQASGEAHDTASAFCELCGTAFCLRHFHTRQDGADATQPPATTPWCGPSVALQPLRAGDPGLAGLQQQARQQVVPCGAACVLRRDVHVCGAADWDAKDLATLDSWASLMLGNSCLIATHFRVKTCADVAAQLDRAQAARASVASGAGARGLMQRLKAQRAPEGASQAGDASDDAGGSDAEALTRGTLSMSVGGTAAVESSGAITDDDDTARPAARGAVDVEGVSALKAAPKRKKRSRVIVNAGQPGVKRPAAALVARRKHRDTDPWPQYRPCACSATGTCGPSCPCAKAYSFCERWCRCSSACSNRHGGCACAANCRTSRCPCFDAGRECDPLTCASCCGTAHGTVRDGERVCANLNMTLGLSRKLAVGLSCVSGWGCFVMEHLRKGDYIGEYTGEMLAQAECERRGQVYDHVDCSYLFQVNEDWALDGRKVGSKLRFANHSKFNNAQPRVMMIDGEHRVGIYAKVDLPAGTELFYDYGYHSSDGFCPQWGDEPVGGKRPGTPRSGTPSRSQAASEPGSSVTAAAAPTPAREALRSVREDGALLQGLPDETLAALLAPGRQ